MLRYHVNAQTLFLSQNKNTSSQVTDRTNYTKTTSRACTKTRAHKKLELKKQNKLCLNTHICAWNFAHNLWKDLRTHFHFCLLSFLVAPFVHRAACASWPRGLGFSRTRLDTSNSLSKGQHAGSPMKSNIKMHIKHPVKTTPQMTRFRDVKVCKNLVTDEIDDHRIQSNYKCTIGLQYPEGKNSTLGIAYAW